MATRDDFNCILGELPLTSLQAQRLDVRSHSQLSPYLEACCLRMSANVSYGSGTVESTVKQIDRRTKLSGAQWKQKNVPQVLAHRCAYLNGLISA